VPQAPQLLLSVCALTQVPLQSVVPVAQPQTPAVHTRPVAQVRPQAPQLVRSVCVLTHTRPQSVEPVGHRQAPIWHVEPIAQAVPQAPQLALSLCVLTQVGAAAIGVQSTWPIGHEGRVVPHTPARQVCPVAQVRPHIPQLASSTWRSAQTAVAPVPQSIWPMVQPAVPVQVPPAQVWPIAQVRPHIPQLAVSVMTLAQAAPQRVWPIGHAIIWQVPPMQT
jgi:hypothetical protein